MIKNVFLFSLFSLVYCLSSAQIGQEFPTISGESLSGDSVEIPSDTEGKYTFVGLAFSKRSENAIKSWHQPIFDKFVLKRGMFDANYDINLMFIPMYTGTKKLAYKATIKELKEANINDLHPYVMFYKGEIKSYVKALKMDKENIPYFFLLDEDGGIVYKTQGMYSEEKMEAIEAILDEL